MQDLPQQFSEEIVTEYIWKFYELFLVDLLQRIG